MPEHFNGVPQIPVHGASITATFTDPEAPDPRPIQYFEQMGHRGLWAEGWKITTYHEPGHPFDDVEWGLYHLHDDFSECHDLAADHPDKLRELIDALVGRGRPARRAAPRRPDHRAVRRDAPTRHRPRPERLRLLPAHRPHPGRCGAATGRQAVGADRRGRGRRTGRGCPLRPWGHNVGHSFFLKDGQLHFDYNALGTHFRATAPLSLSPGRHTIAARFARVDKGGTLTLAVDGTDLVTIEIPKLVRMLGSTGLDVGRDALSPVVDDYEGPFPFTGIIERLSFHLRGRPDAAEMEATARAEMAKE